MKYGTILADPPWPYHSPKAIVGNAGRGSQDGNAATMIQVNVEHHYPTMTIEEISKLDIIDLSEKNAHLYLWATNSFLVEAHSVARAWGFEPKTVLTWVKVQRDDPCRPSMKTGYWYRGATEHIVFGVRGKQRLSGPPVPTAYLLPRLPHSTKPDFFYNLIETQSPGPYLELFARNKRLNWDVWGNEVVSSITIEAKKECGSFPAETPENIEIR